MVNVSQWESKASVISTAPLLQFSIIIIIIIILLIIMIITNK